MRIFEKLRMRFAMLIHRGRANEHLNTELQFHLDQQIAENIAVGMGAEEAHYAAMRSFGNAVVLREQARETWSWGWLESLLQDIRFALRQLWRSPGFVLVTVLTLMLGIGANTAIFTLMNALLLKSLPVFEPNRLVHIGLSLDTQNISAQNIPLNFKMIESLERRTHSFSGMIGWGESDFDLKEGDSRHGYPGAYVRGNTFDVLGIHPAAGRLLIPADDQQGGGPDGWAAMISHQFWVEHYHADPSVIGRHVTLSDHGATIIGVMPKGFEGIITTSRPDFYLPLEYEPIARGGASMLHQPGSLWLTTLARLKPDVTLAQAASDVAAVFPRVMDDTLPPQVRHQPVVDHARLDVQSGHAGWSFLRQQYEQPLLFLQLLVGAVLLICCANLAGLGLARASARQHEFALRVALGAARSRMLRQMLVESFLLAIPGALLGLGFAWAACRMLLRFMADRNAAVALSARPDTLVLFVTAACAVLCSLLFGIAPAWIASRAAPEPALRRTTKGATRTEKSRLRQGFVCVQIALSLTLVVVAGLLSTTLVRLHTGNNGFRTENVLFAHTSFSHLSQKGDALVQLYRQMTMRMEELPGVDAASIAAITPVSGSYHNADFSILDNKAGTVSKIRQHAAVDTIGSHYFSAMGTRTLAGRDFLNRDANENTCILNRSAASAFFPSGSAIGSAIRQYQPNMNTGQTATNDCEVIGVVEDAKYRDLRQPAPPTVYFPVDASSENLDSMTLVIHAHSLDEARDAYIKVLHEFASGAPEVDPIPFAVQFDDSIASERLLTSLSNFFAALALLLSGIGMYGLIAWTVTQRTMEFGVRMALGSTRPRILLLVLRQIFVLILIGSVAGGIAAFFSARAIKSFLYGVVPGSPMVLLAAAGALCVIALLAALVPARRAVSIDPVEALRAE
jgi:predicted permease